MMPTTAILTAWRRSRYWKNLQYRRSYRATVVAEGEHRVAVSGRRPDLDRLNIGLIVCAVSLEKLEPAKPDFRVKSGVLRSAVGVRRANVFWRQGYRGHCGRGGVQ